MNSPDSLVREAIFFWNVVPEFSWKGGKQKWKRQKRIFCTNKIILGKIWKCRNYVQKSIASGRVAAFHRKMTTMCMGQQTSCTSPSYFKIAQRFPLIQYFHVFINPTCAITTAIGNIPFSSGRSYGKIPLKMCSQLSHCTVCTNKNNFQIWLRRRSFRQIRIVFCFTWSWCSP